mmetsp:Transcript_10252/g.13701  ORF Transcript_10252/g.13701 Transcript_10252/m.13701 type:complete len:128 (-) Transcript_10252:358-741(-)
MCTVSQSFIFTQERNIVNTLHPNKLNYPHVRNRRTTNTKNTHNYNTSNVPLSSKHVHQQKFAKRLFTFAGGGALTSSLATSPNNLMALNSSFSLQNHYFDLSNHRGPILLQLVNDEYGTLPPEVSMC